MGTDGTVPWNNVTNTALIGGLPPPEYTAAYHSRNRLYLPDWGRFSSSDPNGTGLPVLDSLTFGGMGLSVSSINPDYQSHYGDGMNTHAAYGGNPLSKRDPSGLFINPLDVAGAAVMGIVRGLRGGLESITEVYADNMDYDLDWAMDWGSPDDWHTRGDNTWVDEAWREGVRGGLQDWLNEDVKGLVDPFELTPDFTVARDYTPGPTTAWRNAARNANKAGRIAHHVISFYKATARRMKTLGDDYGFTFDLQSLDNMLELTKDQHGGGRHRKAYHDRVFLRHLKKLWSNRANTVEKPSEYSWTPCGK